MERRLTVRFSPSPPRDLSAQGVAGMVADIRGVLPYFEQMAVSAE
jgi:hypothetical protein